MAASATETALLALGAKLTAIALASSKIPTPSRNDDLASRLADIGDDVKSYLNQWDGEQTEREEYLGAWNAVAPGYGITHEAKLELAVAGGANDAARETAFDDAMTAIIDGLAEDRTLGGAVDGVEFGELQFQGSGLITDGVPNTKGAVIPVVLTFRSTRPY